jgi:hypothetical protein
MSTPERTIERGRRHRSPSSPGIPIDDAIDRVRQIYEHDRRAFTTVEAILEHLGYSTRGGLSGTSGRVVSALRQYGLLDEQGGQFRVSDLAFRILHLPEGSDERADLVRQAALTPPIFRNLLTFYQGEIPSDAALRSRLVLHEGFNPDSVEQFIRVFRRTLSIANPSVEDYTAGEEPSETPESQAGGTPQMQRPTRSPTKEELNRIFASATAAQLHALGVPVPNAGKELRFNISRDSEAQVIFRGPVTQEAIDKLAKLLELQKDTFPTQAELASRPRHAIWRNKDHDQPVTIIGELGEKDGRRFYSAKETSTGIPEDELEFHDEQAKGAA